MFAADLCQLNPSAGAPRLSFLNTQLLKKIKKKKRVGYGLKYPRSEEMSKETQNFWAWVGYDRS